VIVVVTVAADGDPYKISPLVVPLALIVLVYGTAPPVSQVVEICVPSGDTTSIVAGWPFVPEASVVVYSDPPLVIVVCTAEALGDPIMIVPDESPLAETVLV
jgi:hypothetical protein